MLRLYDLAGAEDDRRFSPNCWRVRLALAHKGLDVETVPWRFTEKERIAASGQGTVPVLEDGPTIVHDSWAIARHLEAAYPARPSLFGGEVGEALSLFVKHWTERTLNPPIFRCIATDLFAHLHEKDRSYFRTSRENRFGMTLEALAADRDVAVGQLRDALTPLRLTLEAQPFLAGDRPAFADYVVFGAFQWARCVSPFPLLEPDDPVYTWRGRLLQAFDGLAGQARGYPV